MRDTAQGSVALSTSSATGKVGFIRAGKDGDLMPGVQAESSAQAAAKATSYLDKYAPAFGARPDELVQGKTLSTPYGWTVTYTQSYRGVPVFGAMLKANVDRQGDLTSVNGYAAPGLTLSTTPQHSATEAAQRAIAFVKAHPAEGVKDMSGLEATVNQLVVYRMGAVKGEAGAAILAHQIEVTNKKTVRDTVIVDATTGKVVNRYSMMDTALDRHLYEAVVNNNQLSFNQVWQEGDPLPGDLNNDQINLVETAGDSYWFYNNTWGRDSYDGNGASMLTVNNDPRIACPNANWNGVTTNYCNGVTSDDVVAHEWGHAYTEYTSGLIYQWQSGALNESYSDVWGETIDLINARDDAGETNGARADGACSSYTRGPVELEINSPAEIAKVCDAAPAAWGPVIDQTGFTDDVVVGLDATGDGDTNTNGCSAFSNAGAIAGNFVYVDRGFCAFQDKVSNAEDAGATGIVVGDHTDEVPFSMSGTADIPGVMIRPEDGAAIKTATGTVNVTMRAQPADPTDDSYRWLIGEKSPAFGGAIRDMWTPTCYGDPGKVSDAEYRCGTDDQGGVHSNSGVTNHAYALLVDGGSYNGVDVNGIGLDKAAQVWWRAQTAYLTPTSDFGDMANALDSSCLSLVGEDIQELSTSPDSPGAPAEPITTADCLSVSAAVLATELRKDPTEQCDFQPLLAKGAPSACGAGSKAKTVWQETFNSGLGKWKQSEEVVYNKGRGYKWKGGVAPDHSTLTAYAPDPQGGSCSGSTGDISSRNSLISPKITMPKKNANNGRLTFDHYVATELGYDGGNVKISVNGGGYQLVKPGAFQYNAYNAHLESAAAGNTNPLEGEWGFTGTDGGKTTGSWGQSQIDLRKLDIGKGDSFKIRFDFGRDGCGGNDGWYVDDVTVKICKNVATRQQELGTKS
ncbi:M4 family metallopeptidase [Nocardioides taihuensis]|uniref:M4 family metallopeptidase n=1 Tax=Nocardioides taihuensis TaxID=1835606 RepID=A0ABW0BQV9_9ACTN